MKINKILSVILAVAMIFGTMTTLVFAEGADLTINTAEDLKEFADMVNDGNDFAGKTVVLAQSIELPDEEWTAIGIGTRSSKSYSGSAFKGTFDGGNNTINGLKITSTTDADAAIGLFGVVDGGAVKNLKLANVNINVASSDLAGGAIGLMVNNATAENITVSGSVVGNDGVGGIVGRMVISGTIKDCTNNASVTSAYGGIGGVVGKAYYEDGANTALFANIVNCTNNGIITAPMYVGGIVGLARANITGCINNGAVVGGTQTGGIAGQLIAAGAVSKNENKAKITGKNHVGGIIGDYTQSNAYTYNNVSITNNVNRGELVATEQCAAILGCNNIDGFTAMVAYNNLSFYNAGGLELFGNPEDMVYDNTNMFVEEKAVALVGGEDYLSINEAIEAAKAITNPVITILAGTYDAFTVPAELNNVKFIGETDTNGNNLVTIKTLEEGIATHTGGVYVQPETATFENLNFTAGAVSVNSRVGGMASSLGKANGDTGMSSNLTNLIIKGCNFTGSGAYQAIWTNVCDVTIIDTTIKNYAKALYSCAIKANQKIAVENSEITDVTYALHLEEATSGSELNVKKTTIDAVVIALGGAVAMNITESEIRNAEVAIWGSSVNISESKLYDTTYSTNTNSSNIIINSNFANNVDELMVLAAKNDNIVYETYYPTVEDLEGKTNLTNADKTSGIAVTFVKDTEDSTGRTYKIVLKAEEGSINDFESAHFTFVNKSAGLDYAITPNTAANITAVDDITNENRISFYMNADENKPVEISGNEIILGTVAFGGYGDADFSIDKADAKVNATTVVDSIVETFTPDSTTNKLYVNWTDADTTDEFLPYIKVEDLFVEQARDLNVVINFNNDITSQSADYTEMKVEVTGQNGEKHLGLVGDEPSVKYDAEMVCATVETDGKTVTLPFTVTAGYRYTVKVSGAGYRTAEYTTVIPVLTPEEYATDEGITLTFWNNVKDEFNKTEIESGSDRWYTKNFLAGEIVQDNKINKYDLAAVVSYFGEDDLVASRPEYNKYDLNRDGVIDSEDIAYVLVSFGE